MECEEMDLLIKWLGPVSSKFSQVYRNSNGSNSSKGLQRIWERLHERYARPEMVESTFKS